MSGGPCQRPWQVGRVLYRQKQDFLEETNDQGYRVVCFRKKKKKKSNAFFFSYAILSCEVATSC